MEDWSAQSWNLFRISDGWFAYDHCYLREAPEWAFPRADLPQDHPERIHIRLLAVLFVFEYLWCGPLGCADITVTLIVTTICSAFDQLI